MDIAVEELNAENLAAGNHKQEYRVHTIVGRLYRTPIPKRGVSRKGRVSGSDRVKCPRFLTILKDSRFVLQTTFGKVSAGGKRRNATQSYRGYAALSRAISARVCAKCFILGRSVVWTLQRA